MTIRSDVAKLRKKIRDRRARRMVEAQMGSLAAGMMPDHFEVAVYFADPPEHLYQLRQWFDSLHALSVDHPVVVIVRSAATALVLQQECPVPVVYAAAHSDLDPIVEHQPLKLALYVNHNLRNFALLWHPDISHVYIGHGESDKIGISASNQLKAYDFCFVSGQAAIDRIENRLINYDAAARVIETGRPQVDQTAECPPFVSRDLAGHDKRIVVLYAPSWEGDRPANSYGSLASHGEAIVSALISTGQHRVIFRPHPLTGSKSPEFAQARTQIVAMIEQANRTDMQAGHIYDTTNAFGWQLEVADAAIADISAVAYDWLPTRKPLVITKPIGVSANTDLRGIAGKLPLLSAEQAPEVPTVLAQAATAESVATIEALAVYYFGDTTPGASTRRWLAAVEDLIVARDAAVAERDARIS